MRAMVYKGPKTLEVGEFEEPKMGPDDALVSIAAVGICGSDMHAWAGHDERRPAPLILGHEASGLVLEGRLKGKRVAINPLVTCGHCDHCLGGRANLCAERQIISMPPRQGAFAERLAIPEGNLVEIPDGLSLAKAALTEPVATAWHAVVLAERHAARAPAEGRALVIGGGAVGLAAALVLAARGCCDIAIAETNPGRRATAARAGRFHVFDPLAEPDAIATGTMDIVLDAVGAKPTRGLAIHAARPGGVIVHIGLLDGVDGTDIRRLTLQEIALVGCYTYTMVDFRAALAAIASGALGSLDWMAERPFAEGPQAFNDLAAGREAAAKIVLRL